AANAGVGWVSIPALAVDDSGTLLWLWGQAETLPDPDARPVVQARHRLYAIRSDDGVDWSEPFPVCPSIPASTHAGLPAVASNGETWWILAYLADDEQTRVVLLRSDDGGDSFELERTLASRAIPFRIEHTLTTRPLPVDEISLQGSYLLRF